MTTPRDPLVVIAKWEVVGRDALEALLMVRAGKTVVLNDEPDGIIANLQAALSASAPMPAPERVGVEEVMKLVEKCVQVHRKWERGEANAGMCNDCAKALESAVRRLGGGS